MNTVNLNATFQDSLSFNSQRETKSVIATIFNGLKNWRAQAKEHATFAGLNNHLLLDIGVDKPVNNDIVVERCWML